MKKNILYTNISILFLLLGLVGCTNLDEEVFSETTTKTFYGSAEEVTANYLKPYTRLYVTSTLAHWICGELSSDCAAWPQKGKHGYDGGKWQQLHWHNWTPEHHEIKGAWNNSYETIGYCNEFLTNMASVDVSNMQLPVPVEQMKAEMRALRAYHYYLLMDNFRNVPVVTKVGEPRSPSPVSADKVIEFIEKEISEVINDLPEKGESSAYGHFTKAAAHMLLAKVYLNSEVYTGQARWQACIDEVNKVTGYSFSQHWQDPFLARNENCDENIFVVPFEENKIGGFYHHAFMMHYSHQQGFNLQYMPWNGIVVQPDHYRSFDAADTRLNQFLVGPQFDQEGNPLMGVEEAKDQPLVLTVDIKNMAESREDEGARSVKYEVVVGEAWGLNNDYVIWRYTDALMMKAEALMRLNKTSDALPLVNKVRERAFGNKDHNYTTSTLTLDEMINERGREFSFEGHRRQDLIRFGKFGDAWWDKKPSGADREIYPYPLTATDNNPNLKN
ncbi:RagB/SusD family nutrient uptake outer membrane protein [Marinilabiliaceae bacterium JC017]|nr:RagB/SusD family nutrient uptake outer membrane protein [Marinilabiliaceae bacterium JC017]